MTDIHPTFRVVKRTDRFTRAGHLKSQVDDVLLTTQDLRAAFAEQFKHEPRGVGRFLSHDCHVSHHVLNEDGTRVSLFILYEREIGPEIVAQQEASPDFFVDLDKWFKGTLSQAMAA